MAKILYSPGFGAGWSTWIFSGPEDDREAKKFSLGYQPLIEALERGEDIGLTDSYRDDPKPGSVLEKFKNDYEAKFGENSSPYLGGARDLTVYDVDRPFRIDEYDGSESVVLLDAADFFDPRDFEVIEGSVVEERKELNP